MDENSLLSILSHPFENGYIPFIIGIFFTLFIYSFSLFIQTKEKTYLYYSIYTLLIFLNQLPNDYTVLSNYFLTSIKTTLSNYHVPTIWLYNTVYFLFVISFVDIKSKSKKWYLLISRVSYSLLIISFIFITLYYFSNNKSIYTLGNKYIIPFLFIFGIICYYPLFKYKLPLKKHIITGSSVLYIASFFGFYSSKLNIYPNDYYFGQTIFLTGLIIENIIFAIAIGRKQRLLANEKEKTQRNLIIQLKENEKIKALETELESKLISLKMSSLRSQMNPHFIFNSLNSIKLYIIENEKNNAIYYLNKFSKLIRKILASTREETMFLNEEIETLKLYIDIENIRFSNEIKTLINVDSNLNINTIKIPSLVLQPFIENAIWHGLSTKKNGKELKIDFIKNSESYLKITIQDNGIGRKKAQELKDKKIHNKKSIGLKLTNERLKNFAMKMDGDYSINITDLYANNKGTKVELFIPLK